MLPEHRWLSNEATREALFLLHNFVAASFTLAEHWRAAYRHLYRPLGLIPNYQSEVDRRFTEEPLVQFVKDLRHVAQHNRLPSLSLQWVFEHGQMGAHLRLQRADLETFDRWTAPSKRFIEAAGETIDIEALASDYHTLVMDFHAWFSAEQEHAHGVTRELYAVQARGGISLRPREIIAQVRERLTALEASREPLAYAMLLDALEPGLTLLDRRLLDYCTHDTRLWLAEALASFTSRVELPDDIRERFVSLIQRDDSRPKVTTWRASIRRVVGAFLELGRKGRIASEPKAQFLRPAPAWNNRSRPPASRSTSTPRRSGPTVS